MKIEIIKEIIKDEYINANDAIWLVENINIDRIKESHNNLLFYYMDEIVKLLKEKRRSVPNLLLKDDLTMFAIEARFTGLLNFENGLDDFEDIDDAYISFDSYEPYTKEQMAKLESLGIEILQYSEEQLLLRLMELIDDRFEDIYNGFNKLEYSRAKRHFWKETLGFEGFEYRGLPENVLKLLNDVYNASEPLVRQKVVEREIKLVPKVTNSFANWIEEHGYKITKTNLKQFLKDKSIKLSNPNIDKIIDDIKSRK